MRAAAEKAAEEKARVKKQLEEAHEELLAQREKARLAAEAQAR